MIHVAIVKRRLEDGKTYEQFRRAWYHTSGFGTRNRMLTVLNAADPREIIVIGLTEATIEQAAELITIDKTERDSHPLDEIIEPGIDRTFGVLIAEDDFSAAGPTAYQPPTVNGETIDMTRLARDFEYGKRILTRLRPDITLDNAPAPLSD